MRIAVIGPEFPPATGGEQEYAFQVAHELACRGHQVVVYSREGSSAPGEKFEVRDVLQGWQPEDWRAIESIRDFDLIHVLNSAWSWVARLKRPTFLSIHGNDFVSPNPVYGFDIKRRLNLPKGDRVEHWLTTRRTRSAMKKCLPLCRAIFSNSDYTKSVFLEKYPSCRGRVVTAGVGVGSRFINRRFESRRGQGVPRLLTVCRLSEPRKNVDVVLRALAGLRAEFAFNYTIVGDGDLRPALSNLAVELGLADRVNFVGRVDDTELISHYENADLFVLPSGASATSFEGFGIVYIEANAMGVPTMAVRAGGSAEAVEEGLSGFFVQQPTVEAVRDGLRAFVSGEKVFRPEDCQQFAAR